LAFASLFGVEILMDLANHEEDRTHQRSSLKAHAFIRVVGIRQGIFKNRL
jgi:hypothetical protein